MKANVPIEGTANGLRAASSSHSSRSCIAKKFTSKHRPQLPRYLAAAYADINSRMTAIRGMVHLVQHTMRNIQAPTLEYYTTKSQYRAVLVRPPPLFLLPGPKGIIASPTSLLQDCTRETSLTAPQARLRTRFIRP